MTPFFWGKLYFPLNLPAFLFVVVLCVTLSMGAQAEIAKATSANPSLETTDADDGLVMLSPAQQLLRRMTSANDQLTYKGRFTYEHGGALSTLEVFHDWQQGVVRERLVHLNGPRRELMRHSSQIEDCNKAANSLLKGFSSLAAGAFSDHYDQVVKGGGRVAGREVDVLHLVPKDKYRFGYSLSLDKETGLLLQAMLIGLKRQVLERFQFVDVEIGALLASDDLEPVEQNYYVVSSASEPCQKKQGDLAENPWLLEWLPVGFMLSDYQAASVGEPDVLVYTDGVAVFSVFVERNPQALMPEVQGQRGATVAFMMNKQQGEIRYSVCIVGEIPSATARQVAQSLSLSEE